LNTVSVVPDMGSTVKEAAGAVLVSGLVASSFPHANERDNTAIIKQIKFFLLFIALLPQIF
jgi:hypothetical protein